MRRIKNKTHFRLALVALLGLLPAGARAQISGAINPALAQDSRVLFFNPASAALLPGQAYFGLKLIYPGAIANNTFALRNSLFAASWPQVFNSNLGVGAHVRWLSSPWYRDGRMSFALAYRLREQFALGIDLGMLVRGYETEQFDLVDQADPVFRAGHSRTVFDPAIGASAKLTESLSLGASLFHLNQPNVALAKPGYRLPLEALLGASYALRFVRVDVGMEYRREEWRPSLGAEIFSDRLGRLRAGLGGEHAVFEGQLRIHERVAMFYGFNAPTNDLSLLSAGSHEVGMIFSLPWPDRNRREARPDFLLQAMPPSRVVLPDDTPIYQLTLLRRDDFKTPITLTTQDLPPHLKSRFSQTEVRANAEIVLALHSEGGLAPGDYPFIVTATAGERVQHLPLHVRVDPMPKLAPEIFTTVDSVDVVEVRNVVDELPIIPRIFFPANQSALAGNRYDVLSPRQNVFVAENAREINFVYRNALNLIAGRLRQNAQARITLTGYSAGSPHEKDWLRLAQARAQAVKEYLVDSLAVNPAQIASAAPQRPPARVTLNNVSVQEEWQRVAITANAPFVNEILAPLLVEKKEVEAQPEHCGFVTKYSVAEAGVAEWRITILNGNRDTVEVLAGEKALPDTVRWAWPHALVKKSASNGSNGNGPHANSASFAAEQNGYYSLWLKDALGQTASTALRPIGIRHRRRLNEVGVERIPIFLFGFGEHQLGSFSRELRLKLHSIAEKLESDPLATCVIKGHTDDIGEARANQWLSRQRAKTVFDVLVSYGIAPGRITHGGVGEDEPLADNRLPEGRNMNRRVEVYIRHSAEWRAPRPTPE
jgi:outer membrane protein OmpA-like peptidoglycan-associated protein